MPAAITIKGVVRLTNSVCHPDRDVKVSEVCVSRVVEQNVVGLDVAVNDVDRPEVVEGAADLGDDEPDLLLVQDAVTLKEEPKGKEKRYFQRCINGAL